MTDLIANPAPNRASSVFTEELLRGFARRTAKHDRENSFFTKDFEELRQIGYLKTVLGIHPDETPRWG